MADERVLIKESTLTAMGNSIRAKTGKTELINPDNMPAEIDGISSGSNTPVDKGPIYEGKYRVRYFDTDGTILKIEYVESGGKTTPPDTPSYDPDYLIFAEWNYDTDNYIVEQPTDIGAIYDTIDDVTYMFCRFTTNTGLNPTLAITGATSINWGDGTVDTNVSHTYANEGEYVIKIYGNVATGEYILGSTNLNKALKKCYIKNGVTSIGSNAFSSCYSLTSVTIPESVTSIGSNAFSSCYSLTSVTIPKGVTFIALRAFISCYSLTSITIPESVTSIANFAFNECHSLTNITIPYGVTYIGSNAFFECFNLTSILITNSIKDIGVSKNIGTSAFSSCYSLTDYFIDCDTVPTMSTSFGNINPSAIMWVKDSIIEQLKVATNWSDYADYMKPLSWYPSLTDPNA